jgi:hypothetical protein
MLAKLPTKDKLANISTVTLQETKRSVPMLPDSSNEKLAPSTIDPTPMTIEKMTGGHHGLSEHGDLVLAMLECQQPQDFAPTCYGPDGKLLPNDEDLMVFCKQLFEELVDPATAKRVARELDAIEEKGRVEWAKGC